jgi:endonuclease/exonuclease/phosphatase family metal-dependent hydrolase
MVTSLRIITLNLCYECSKQKNKNSIIQKLTTLIKNIKPDIICLQEIGSFDMPKLIEQSSFRMLRLNKKEETCIIINPLKLKKKNTHIIEIKATHQTIYVSVLHLDDIPSIVHKLHNIPYSYQDSDKETKDQDKVTRDKAIKDDTLHQMLELSKKTRLPRVKKELNKCGNFEKVIMAGDFNEPSHLDMKGLNLPISKELKKNNFIDSHYAIHKNNADHTWPVGRLYKNEPKQRIDFIYTKNLKAVNAEVYDEGNSFFSDHKLVLTDIIV